VTRESLPSFLDLKMEESSHVPRNVSILRNVEKGKDIDSFLEPLGRKTALLISQIYPV
jgi:hypothetical protein